MTPELENRLYRTSPIFFQHAINCREGKEDRTQTCMYWGGECGDGWFVPIEKLVGKIHLLNRFCKGENLQIVCSQLKEKHGEFTCYFHVESAVDHEPFDRKVAAAVSEMVDDFMLV